MARTLTAQDLSSLPLQQFGIEFTAGPWKLTFSDLARGADAATQLAAVTDQNQPPEEGVDYLLFQVSAANAGQERLWIDYDDFAVLSASGIVRRSLELMPPDPMLQAAVEPGQSIAGWVVGAIESDDPAPVILFDSRLLTGIWADQVVAIVAGGTFPAAPAQPAAANDAGSSPSAPVAVNQPIVTADWQVELLQAVFGQDVYELTDFRTQAVGDSDPSLIPQWAAIQVQVTNNRSGSAVAHFPVTAFSLSDADGEEILDVARLTPPLPDIAGDYLPGATRTGWAAFEQPVDFTGSLVRFQPYRTDTEIRYLTWGDGSAPQGAQQAAAQENETPPAPSEAFASGSSVITNDSDVNMRAEASTSAEVIAVLSQGTELTITGDPVEADGYTWYPVEASVLGVSGFVVADFLETAA
jgi:hypothetical protein